MKAARNGSALLLAGLQTMDLASTLFGGQTFRWRRTGDATAEGWIGDRPVSVALEPDGLRIAPRDRRRGSLDAIAARYFDASRDYARIERSLARHCALRGHARGLRILRQPPFETVIGFIVSANNNIARITRSMNAISTMAGAEVDVANGSVHAFPTPHRLAALSIAELRNGANLGYRDRYVHRTSAMIAAGDVDLDAIDTLSSDELVAELAKLDGVGPKVAECIALFAYGRFDVFPVDTWIRRAYTTLYLGDGETATDRQIGELARKRFGAHAGVAQQYLFELIRSKKIGAETRTATSDPPSRRRAV